jgi:hypothetical protein
MPCMMAIVALKPRHIFIMSCIKRFVGQLSLRSNYLYIVMHLLRIITRHEEFASDLHQAISDTCIEMDKKFLVRNISIFCKLSFCQF